MDKSHLTQPSRRRLLQKGTLGLSAAAIAPSAFSQTGPSIRWRLASSFPKSLDTIYGGAEVLSKRLNEITGGKFQISVHAAGELMPAFGVVDALQNGGIECAHTASYYFVGKNRTFGFETTLPFGLNQRQQNAWMYYGGGLQLVREFLRDYNIVNFPGGNTGVQMGGWFKKEIKSLADIKGLKMRIPGIGGEIMAKLGAIPQQIPGGEIYQALERGTIDGAEWVGPYDDEKLGFNKVAKYYYTPGWWEGNAPSLYLVNTKAWDSLPKEYQNAFNRYQTQRNNIYNTLAGIAGIGQTAAGQTVNAANAYGQNLANLITGSAAAQAAGLTGSTNALANTVGNVANTYMLSSLLGQRGSIA